MSSTYEPVHRANRNFTTSWIPFTTAWTAPTECSHLFVAHSGEPKSGLTVFDPDYEKHINTNIACYPPEITSFLNQDGEASTKVTSLGPFKCPGNWFEAATQVVSETWTWTHCCPSGYDVLSSAGLAAPECLSTFETNQLTYAYSTDSSWYITATVSPTPTGTDGAGALSHSYNPYTATAFSLIAGYNIATASSTSKKNSTSNAGGGLSTGAKVGIGVGVGVGVPALLALLGFLYLLHRRRKTTEETGSDNQQPVVTKPSELDGKGLPNPHELQTGGNVPELGAQGDGLPRRELEGMNDWPPVELSASR